MAPHAEIPDTPPNGPSGGLQQPATNGIHVGDSTPFASGVMRYDMPEDRNAIPAGYSQQEETPQNSRPNILYIMADQMAAPLLSIHDPNSPIQTPNLEKLAREGVCFDSAYNNSPLCAPSRFCMVSGQLPSKIKAYDNASFLPSDTPTYAHYLRSEGYETVLAGKMHFIGADQLHGYEHRLTADIYPGDFGWSVNWDKPDERQEWYHNMSSVLQAGPCARSNQLDFDEEVMYKSTQYLYDHVRQGKNKRPFCLTVSLTHPHDPYTMTDDYWEQYADTDIPLPKVHIKEEEQDPHSKRILKAIDAWKAHLPEEAIKRARRAYYGACSYVDDQIGLLLKTLKRCRLDKNTIIIFSGDHGDMLGERGLWYKMSWYENSARVPFIVHYPGKFAPKRIQENVSTMDMLPTLVDMVGGQLASTLRVDGVSLYKTVLGEEKPSHTVYGEYMGEGTISPVMMIRQGPWKYTTCLTDPPQLYNLEDDKLELNNLCESTDPKHLKVAANFAEQAKQKWNLQAIHDDVLYNQRQRRLCWTALKVGTFAAWDYQPTCDDATKKYIRSTIPLDDLELKARYPVVDALGRDHFHGAQFASHHGAAAAYGQ